MQQAQRQMPHKVIQERWQFCVATLIAAASLVLGAKLDAHAQNPCTPNPIVCENSKPGNLPSEWDISSAGASSIQGFATQISVNQGETVHFKINNTGTTSYRLDIYRMGYYGGNGARKVATIGPAVPLPQNQPACLTDNTTGLIDCGNWAESASWPVPSDATSGIYFVKLVRQDGGASHIFFVVRSDSGQSDILFQTSDTTWQAYNTYGGNSLYVGSPAGRAYKVSYNRPITTRATSAEDFVFTSEYPMVRWLEANGYNVSYFTGVDSDARGAAILQHKVFLSVGHDEYWSGGQRTKVEGARAAGVHLGFFSSNEVFWKTRWENSIDGSSAPYRTLVSYKETHANAVIDPQDPPIWTGTWRDPRFSPPADGGRPENALTGTIFTVNGASYAALAVPAADGKMRFWRNTSVATLASGQTAVLPNGTIGYEWDEDLDNGSGPAGLIRLSSTTVDVSPKYLLNYGSTYGSGTATHRLTLYRHSSGALVFGAGSGNWSWGLDGVHDSGPFSGTANPDVRMKQATVNLLADMGVQPATLQSGLVLATASTDSIAPTSTITSPTTGSTVQTGAITITGTAIDTGGGVVGGVEVSVDGGTAWHPATGRENWSYTWQPSALGSATIISRAVDDSGNLESSPHSITVSVQPRTCPCSIWNNATIPAVAADPDPNAVELGLKFQADVNGSITAIRFYKGAGNTGTHMGHLWDSSGHSLASVSFTNETATGWQQANLPTPVAITANTTYVVSYYDPAGHYALNEPYFTTEVSNPPLRALADGTAGGNGVYQYGPSGFPTLSFNKSNYWVDVVFNTTAAGPDTTPPTVTAVSFPNGTTNVDPGANITATFSEVMDAATITTSTFLLRDSSGASVSATVTYDAATSTATLNPNVTLAALTTYTATIKSGASGVKDAADNPLEADFIWSFTTAAPSSCPCSLWSNSTTPAAAENDNQAIEVGLKFQADVNGSITAIRFYKAVQDTGAHVGNLWDSSGHLLASVSFTNETASGWQQATLSTPWPVNANTTYVVSYYSPGGWFSYNLSYFTAALVKPPLRALADGTAGNNGVFKYGASGFPTQGFNASNYWVDVVFNTTVAPDTAPPTVSGKSPAAGATGVATGATVQVTFSEAINPATITTSSFELRTAANTLVAAGVSYNGGTLTATLTPQSPLARRTTYTARVKGGAGGVKDVAGNALAADVSWSFTTR